MSKVEVSVMADERDHDHDDYYGELIPPAPPIRRWEDPGDDDEVLRYRSPETFLDKVFRRDQ